MIKFLYLINKSIEIIFCGLPTILIGLLTVIIVFILFYPLFYLIIAIILIVSLFKKKFFKTFLAIVLLLLFIFFIKFIIYTIIEYIVNSKISITYIAQLFVLHNGFTISLIVLLSAGSLYCINYLLLYILSEEFRVEKRQKLNEYIINLEEKEKEDIKRLNSGYYDRVDQQQVWWEERRKRRQEKEYQDRAEEDRVGRIEEERNRYNEQCAKAEENRAKAEEERRAEENRDRYNDFWKT